MPIGHILDKCFIRGTVLESYRVTDFVSKLTSKFLSNSSSHAHGSYSSRLGHTNFAKLCIPNIMKILGNLCCFPRSSLSNNDYYFIVSNCSQEFITVWKHWQALTLVQYFNLLFLFLSKIFLSLFQHFIIYLHFIRVRGSFLWSFIFFFIFFILFFYFFFFLRNFLNQPI